jgi:hypothetical protein
METIRNTAETNNDVLWKRRRWISVGAPTRGSTTKLMHILERKEQAQNNLFDPRGATDGRSVPLTHSLMHNPAQTHCISKMHTKLTFHKVPNKNIASRVIGDNPLKHAPTSNHTNLILKERLKRVENISEEASDEKGKNSKKIKISPVF